MYIHICKKMHQEARWERALATNFWHNLEVNAVPFPQQQAVNMQHDTHCKVSKTTVKYRESAHHTSIESRINLTWAIVRSNQVINV